jgi:S-adenosylmethionine synthetase
MSSTISLKALPHDTIEDCDVEIVERKGQGHPDFLTDGASEAVSRELCKYYLKTFGAVLHHNVDKGLLVGGKANPYFGGGEVIEPIYLVVAGRAVTTVKKNGQDIPVPIGSIALKAIREFLNNNLRFLDVNRHVIINYMIKQGSTDLIKTFDAGQAIPIANDTSFGVSYAPLSQTEQLVLETERYLNSPQMKKQLPEVGEDIKVMGLRQNNSIVLTIAAPQISSLTPDLEHYLSVKEDVVNHVADRASKITDRDISIFVNTADNIRNSVVYLTVTGTSAEQGDDGNTGRGNRINGLITPGRPMSMEAAAGKNPINHVGKIYNVLAKQLANQIYTKTNGIAEIYIKILSQIGKPITQPLITDVQLVLEKNIALTNLKYEIEGIIEENLINIQKISEQVIAGQATLF